VEPQPHAPKLNATIMVATNTRMSFLFLFFLFEIHECRTPAFDSRPLTRREPSASARDEFRRATARCLAEAQ
jgi:hypothetical protein